jgi:hypothetical protein
VCFVTLTCCWILSGADKCRLIVCIRIKYECHVNVSVSVLAHHVNQLTCQLNVICVATRVKHVSSCIRIGAFM